LQFTLTKPMLGRLGRGSTRPVNALQERLPRNVRSVPVQHSLGRKPSTTIVDDRGESNCSPVPEAFNAMVSQPRCHHSIHTYGYLSAGAAVGRPDDCWSRTSLPPRQAPIEVPWQFRVLTLSRAERRCARIPTQSSSSAKIEGSTAHLAHWYIDAEPTERGATRGQLVVHSQGDPTAAFVLRRE
jgi:hypothetical protein